MLPAALLHDIENSALNNPLDELSSFSPSEYDSLAWGIARTEVDEVWTRYGITGVGALLAILDTGVQPNHPDMLGQLWINEGEIPHNGIDDDANDYVDDYHGYNFVSFEGDEIPWDDRNHGTHVGGTMVGNGTYGHMTGMAPGAKLMVLKTINVMHKG